MPRNSRHGPPGATSAVPFGYNTNISIDYVTGLWYFDLPSSLMEGRLPETVLRRSGEWRPAAAARNRGLGRSGTPPARHDDLAARSSLYGSGGNAGDGSAAPGQKPPRWSAERRASRVMGRAALTLRESVASRKRDTRDSAPVGAPPTPLRVGCEWIERPTRAQQRAAGTNNTALFDIVNRDDGQRFASRAAASHASCARPTLVSRRAQRDTDLGLARDRQLDEASRLNPTCVDLGATQTIRRPANYIALRKSLRWIPALIPSASPLCTRPGHDRRTRPPAGLALRGAGAL